jgi:hypothetical protein
MEPRTGSHRIERIRWEEKNLMAAAQEITAGVDGDSYGLYARSCFVF